MPLRFWNCSSGLLSRSQAGWNGYYERLKKKINGRSWTAEEKFWTASSEQLKGKTKITSRDLDAYSDITINRRKMTEVSKNRNKQLRAKCLH